MPWCESCERFWKLPGQDGVTQVCPDCGAAPAPPVATPWHFKLLVVALVVYLGWRAVQGIVWVVRHL